MQVKVTQAESVIKQRSNIFNVDQCFDNCVKKRFDTWQYSK